MLDLARAWQDAQARGDDAAGWAIADLVLAGRDPAGCDDPGLPYHRRWVWDGTPPDGRDVLVRCYHGLGDTIQFARFLPALARRARRLRVAVQPALLPLLQQIDGVHWRPFDVDRPRPAAACTLEIMELSHALRLGPASVPIPYLMAAPWPGYADAVGVCTRAGDWDAARSLPAGLLDGWLAGRRVVSLELGRPRFRAENGDGAPAAIADLARLMAGLGLVISVDTMVAHLAGALGVPTWLLLKYDADWRWTAGDRWYPRMRLWRQARAGVWAVPDWLSRAADCRQSRAALAEERSSTDAALPGRSGDRSDGAIAPLPAPPS